MTNTPRNQAPVMAALADELKACPFCGGPAELHKLSEAAWQIECGNDQSCLVCVDVRGPLVATTEAWNTRAASPATAEPGVGQRQLPEGWRAVPIEPTEVMWGGLARAIVMWTRFDRPSERSLLQHLNSSGEKIPSWLSAECRDVDRVPPKGSVAVWIYRAMLSASPAPHPEVKAGLMPELERGIARARALAHAKRVTTAPTEVKAGNERAFPAVGETLDREEIERLRSALQGIECHELRDYEDFNVIKDIAYRARQESISRDRALRSPSGNAVAMREATIKECETGYH